MTPPANDVEAALTAWEAARHRSETQAPYSAAATLRVAGHALAELVARIPTLEAEVKKLRGNAGDTRELYDNYRRATAILHSIRELLPRTDRIAGAELTWAVQLTLEDLRAEVSSLTSERDAKEARFAECVEELRTAYGLGDICAVERDAFQGALERIAQMRKPLRPWRFRVSEPENQPDAIAQARNFMADCRFSDEFVGNVSRSRLLPFLVAALESERVARQAAETEASRAKALEADAYDYQHAAEDVAIRLETEAQRLREALDRYGWHVSTCSAWDIEDPSGDCDCGYEDHVALVGSPPSTEPKPGEVLVGRPTRDGRDTEIQAETSVSSDVPTISPALGSVPSTDRGRAAISAPFEEGGGSGSGQHAAADPPAHPAVKLMEDLERSLEDQKARRQSPGVPPNTEAPR